MLEPLVQREGLAGLTLEQTQDRDAHGVPQVWARGRDVQGVGFPIDVVYTWVDGADAEWAKRKAHAKAAVEGEIASTTAAKKARGLVLEQCGAYPTRKYFHAPAALTRSRQEELERIFPAEFAATRAAQFRTTEDIAAAGSLTMAYGLATGSVVTGRIRYDYIDPAVPDGAARMRRYLKARNMDTFCINDGSTEESPEERRATHDRIAGWLEEFLPVRSSFEREEDTVTSA